MLGTLMGVFGGLLAWALFFAAPLEAEPKPADPANEASEAAPVDAAALFQSGSDAFFGRNGQVQDYAEAARLFEAAARAGHRTAQFNLGVMLSQGQGVAQDLEAAADWYLKAAIQGDVDAQNNLAISYVRGLGVEVDVVEGIAWAKVAAAGEESPLLDRFRVHFRPEQMEAATDRALQLSTVLAQIFFAQADL